jgi:hypothetical protein
MKLLLCICLLSTSSGCAATSRIARVSGSYVSAPRVQTSRSYTRTDDGRVEHAQIVYELALNRDGRFQASHSRSMHGIALYESATFPTPRDPHEFLSGTWHIERDRITLTSKDRHFDVAVRRVGSTWSLVWAGITYQRKPNQAPEPMSELRPAAAHL